MHLPAHILRRPDPDGVQGNHRPSTLCRKLISQHSNSAAAGQSEAVAPGSLALIRRERSGHSPRTRAEGGLAGEVDTLPQQPATRRAGGSQQSAAVGRADSGTPAGLGWLASPARPVACHRPLRGRRWPSSAAGCVMPAIANEAAAPVAVRCESPGQKSWRSRGRLRPRPCCRRLGRQTSGRRLRPASVSVQQPALSS